MAHARSVGCVVERIDGAYRAGHRLVVVVSAADGETQRLIDETVRFTTQPDPAAVDLLLATGEQASVARLVLALAHQGVPAEPFTGARAGVLTDSVHGKARVCHCDTRQIERVLAAGRIAVVAGFQGVDTDGRVTTLGRGGSDTTAVALAAALRADECRIYTDVDGVYTADPRIEPRARRLDYIHCEEMLELAGLGSKVLATESVDYAAEHRVPLRVLSTFSPGAGTAIRHQPEVLSPPVVGVAASAAEAELAAIGLPARPGLVAELIAPLAEARIAVDAVLQNEVRQGRSDVSFTMARRNLVMARRILSREAGRLGAERLIEDAGIAKVSLIGRGLRSNTVILSRALAALERVGVSVRVVVANETRLSVLVPEVELEQAVRVWHAEFELGEPSA